MPVNKKWIIITSGTRPLKDISADLEKHGFKVQHELDAIGQITGEGSEEIHSKLKSVQGVTDIFDSHEDIQLGDPDMEVTW